MPNLPINEKPYYNTDQVANAIASNDMWDCIIEAVPGVGNVTRRRPGLKPFANLGTGAQGDGLFWWDDAAILIAVSAGRVFKVNANGTSAEITGAPLNAGVPVVFSAGNKHDQTPWLYMANGKLVYSVEGAATVAPTDSDTPEATHVGWIDQKFIANKQDTNQFLFTDVNDNVTRKAFSLNVVAGTTPVITTTEIRPGLPGGAGISQQFTAEGGTPPYTWTAPGLPYGFALSPAGLLFNTTSAVEGYYPILVAVQDSLGVMVTKPFSFGILAPPNQSTFTMTTTEQPAGTTGVLFKLQCTAIGGAGVLTWTATGLPAWLSITTAGLLSGTPPAAGTFAFSVSVSTPYTSAISKTITVTVADQPVLPGSTLAITTAALPDATIGVAYSETLAATGAVGTPMWSLAGLPVGLSMDDTGLISGVPTGPPNYSALTVSVSDSSIAGFFDNSFWSGANNPVICGAQGQKLVQLMVVFSQVYAWGTLGCQIFQDNGVTPFVNIPGAFIEAGLEAPYSVRRGNNAIFALCVIDGQRVVVQLVGSTPRVISEPIARVLAEMATVSDAIGDLVSVGGLSLYILQFPTAQQTWAYDYRNDEWFRWGAWNADTANHDNFIGQHACFAKAWNKHLIMSRADGKIYELDRNTFSDADAPMVSYRRTGWIDHGMIWNRKRSSQLYIKVKVFAQDGATNPVLLMRWRDDGKPGWSQYLELPLNPDAQGDCLIKLNRMGTYRTRQYEFRITDNVDLALIGATENVQEMRN